MPTPPQSIARYQIIRMLGEGGMGSVFLAKDPEIDRLVAIKLLRGGLDESLRERFRREARAIGQLHHINIVMVFDVGEHDGSPFFAMEYIEGQTLAQIIRSGAAIPLPSAIHWIDGLCAGLHYAHKRGIVHRDIKPANLVVDEENTIKILDFGIARGQAPGMTQAGVLLGTPNYMSPEQISGEPADRRSDAFAVGTVFFELLTGKRAFPGDIRTGVLRKILASEHPPLRELAPAVPEGLAAIIERCLSRNPADRFPDLEMFRNELARLSGGLLRERRKRDEQGTRPVASDAVGATPAAPDTGARRQEEQRRSTAEPKAREAAPAAASDTEKTLVLPSPKVEQWRTPAPPLPIATVDKPETTASTPPAPPATAQQSPVSHTPGSPPVPAAPVPSPSKPPAPVPPAPGLPAPGPPAPGPPVPPAPVLPASVPPPPTPAPPAALPDAAAPRPRAERAARSRSLTPVARALPGWVMQQPRWVWIAGAAAVAVAAIVWLSAGRGAAPAPVAVFIDIRPWATVESIARKADGSVVDIACPATPCLVNLAPGDYHVSARNPFFPNPAGFDITVAAGAYQEIRHRLPDLNPEEEARRILGGPGR
jgi:serine/threonine-protein kinase